VALVRWLRDYGCSDCVFCDIVAHEPWEPARFVYEDDEISVFHNVLGWIPVMLIAVPKSNLLDSNDGRRHYEQKDLWRSMGQLGGIAMALGRTYCQFDGQAQFRLVCNFGPLALQTQSHAHVHILGNRFPAVYPDIRCTGRLVYEDSDVSAFSEVVGRAGAGGSMKEVMIVPRAEISQDEFFATMQAYGERILQIAEKECGASYRLLAELGPHSPTPLDGAHIFVLGGVSLGHYV
jgi:diadenosine tetraphosphate (Ap4A) HIT family hydrolase